MTFGLGCIMIIRNCKIIISLVTGVLVAVVAGSGAKASAQGCTSCCATPCCAATMQETAGCGSNNPSCNGSISFNVCGGLYGTYFSWIEDVYYCCGIQFCSDDYPGSQCGGGYANLMRRDRKRGVEREASAWAVFVLDCAGKYELLEPAT